ncbi:MAG: zinc ribbon domain-containing protein, partial [Chloroflexi bacterium]|nr:zinc ribbon domain-containing protein [Chloroflexota bacterium]
KERLEFLALVEGFHHKQVNPAYTSQMCPTCLFVHKTNRRGDIFQYLNCGHTDYADWIAANNLLVRCHDKEITIYTPKSVLKNILQRRFSASLQNLGEHPKISVSGRTDAHSTVQQSETSLPNLTIGAVQECLCFMTF